VQNNINYLFACEAQELLEAGLFQETVVLCKAGLKEYPDYPLAYSILSEAYLGLNDFDSAGATISAALERFPIYKSLTLLSEKISQNIANTPLETISVLSQEYVEKQFDQLKKENIILFSDFKNIIYPEKIDSADELYSKLFFMTLPEKPADSGFQDLGKAISESADYFRKLAESIGSGKIKVDESSMEVVAVNDDEEPSIVSEAMAEIYVSQGAIKTAIKSYSLLIEKNPEKKELYEKKINELENL
jgi:tetratricopeptide (TPR) repeat protein